MSAHEELVARARLLGSIAGGDPEIMDTVVRTVLAEVLRTLETVTPEMFREALDDALVPSGDAQAAWISMLRASPLTRS